VYKTTIKMTKEKKNLTEQERKAYSLVGRHGGQSTFKKCGRKHMSAIGKKGAAKRWGL
jgi:general stress protein YciG